MNYDLLVKSLRAEYDHATMTAEAAKTKLMNRCQLDDESINDFGVAIKSLVRKAFPNDVVLNEVWLE